MSQALIVRNAEWTLATFNEEAQRIKNDALAKSALIGRVTNAEENSVAVEAQTAVNDILKLVEKSRKACKEPALRFGELVDDAAKAFRTELLEEQLRLARLVGDFQQLEQAKVIAAERARRLEEERIEREKQDAIIKAAREAAERERVLREATERQLREEQERQRKADAANMLALKAEQEATNAKQRQEAESRRKELEARTEQERIEAERRRIELESAQARSVAESHAELDAISNKYADQAKDLPPANITPARAAGQRITDDWEIQVNDIHLLYRHHPNCVELTPRLSEIKNLLKGGTTPKGVNAKAIVKAGVSSGRPRPLIEV